MPACCIALCTRRLVGSQLNRVVRLHRVRETSPVAELILSLLIVVLVELLVELE